MLKEKLSRNPEKFERLIQETEIFRGETFKRVREIKDLSIDEVSKEICVRRVYLEAIETESFDKFPPAPIYFKSFLKNYIAVLQLPEQQVLEDYLRIYDAWKRHH